MKRTLAILLTLLMAISGLSMPAMAETADADVIIVGAGGAGLSAALEAVANGAEKVILLEMTGKTGGALTVTSGTMSAAGTKVQAEENIEDTVESYIQDIMNNGSEFGGQPNKELITVYANEAAAAFDWLYDNGVKDLLSRDRVTGLRSVFAPEHALYSVARSYKASAPEGYKSAAHYVLDTLVKAESKIEVRLETEVTKLVANEKGQVLSVVANSKADGEYTLTASKAVIMCTGGYSSNRKLMGEYSAYGEYYLAGGTAVATGKGIRLMQEVGAGITAMDAIPTFPMGLVARDDDTRGQIASTYTWKTGGIVVNQEGKRFTNETESNPAPREVALEEQPGAVQYDIYTDKILADLAATGQNFFMAAYFANETSLGAHVMYSGNTIEELAAAINVPAENLKKTIEEYNAAVEKGQPDEFGREYNVKNTYNLATNKVEGDKYYAIRLHALCVMTLGGVTANTNMQVLDENGNVIPGLYAAGECVGGIWGKFVSGGTGVMGPIVFGKIAARHALANTPAEGYEVKAAAKLLDEAFFAKEEVAAEKLFDMTKTLKDGEYTATVDGHNAPLTVVVTIKEGKIADVKVTDHKETVGLSDPAIAQIPEAIKAANDPSVDAISSATVTSKAIMNAVAKALEEAAK